MRRKTSASLLYLIFVFSVAKGGSWVERLVIDKDYGSDCNASVTCHVHSEDIFILIMWTCDGGPYVIGAKNQIPHVRTGEVRSVGLYKYKQSATLSECYSKVVLTCEIQGSSKSVTLTSGKSIRNDSDQEPLSGMEILAIALGVIFVLSLICGCIGITRRKRTQGVVIGGILNPNPIEPTYPTQPIPADYTEYPKPPPYQEVTTQEQNLP